MPETAPPAMIPVPTEGRMYVANRVVRLGDVLPSSRLRLDALVRHTQEVSNDDTTEAGLDDDLAWIARSTRVQTASAAVLEENLEFKTFCGAIGPRWAERRLSVTGNLGAHYEVATLWVSVDPQSGRPRKVSPQFHELYGEAAGGRKVSARLTVPQQPPPGSPVPWPARAVDFDTFGHMNNAVYWATVEDVLAGCETPSGTESSSFTGTSSFTDTPNCAAAEVVLEYHAGIQPGTEVSYQTKSDTATNTMLMWWLSDLAVCAAARVFLRT